VLSAIAARIPETTDITPRDISRCLYGMQNMSSSSKSVREMLLALAVKLEAYGEGSITQIVEEEAQAFVGDKKPFVHSMTAAEASRAFYGLKNMDSNHRDVRAVLTALEPAVKYPAVPFTAAGIAEGMYGLQCMDLRFSVVRDVLNAFATQIGECKEDFSSTHIARCLFGVQNMGSGTFEMRRFLNALTKKICDSSHHLADRDFNDIFVGIQRMKSADREVRYLISSLSSKVKTCPDNLSSWSIASMLNSIQGCSTDHYEVSEFAEVIANKLEHYKGPSFTADELSRCMSGMVAIMPGSAASRRLCRIFASIVDRFEGTLTFSEISTVVGGLQSLSVNEDVESLIEALGRLIRRSISSIQSEKLGFPNSANLIDTADEVLCADDLGSLLSGFQNLNSSSAAVRSLLSSIKLCVHRLSDILTGETLIRAAFGLRAMHSDHEDVREIFSILAEHVRNTTYGYVSASDILYAVSCCRELKSCKEVDDYITSLASKLNQCIESCTSDAISEAFVGLNKQNLNPSTKMMLMALAQKMRNSLDKFEERHTVMISAGLQSMIAEDALVSNEVLDILEILRNQTNKDNATNEGDMIP
jgi:hypothetical protein